MLDFVQYFLSQPFSRELRNRAMIAFAWSIAGLPITAILLPGCADKGNQDHCCSYSDLRRGQSAPDGLGLLSVDGSTSADYYVLDENGDQLDHQKLNETLQLEPGQYIVMVNNTRHPVIVEQDKLTRCATGTLQISGHTPDHYYVLDSTGRQLGRERLGKAMSFFPGQVKVKVNNTECSAEVKINELSEVRTGTLVVKGNTGEYYYVLDEKHKQLNYNVLDKALAFFPGKYVLKVNNTSVLAEVFAGQVAEIGTGSLLVRGLTEEYYYVTDTLGNALNYQNLNKALAFFPGFVTARVNNTQVVAEVKEGQQVEFLTGGLMLTGNGSDYYYVLDEYGNQLNYNILNRSLSLFPSEYMVKLGSNYRKATVMAGKMTSVKAYH